MALALGRLLLQDVTRKGVPSPDLAGGGDLEALLSAGVGLHLRHRARSKADGSVSAGSDPGTGPHARGAPAGDQAVASLGAGSAAGSSATSGLTAPEPLVACAAGSGVASG